MTVQGPRPDRGALSIPAADGYHYADDHPWEPEDQLDLIKMLRNTVERVKEQSDDAPGSLGMV
jgi:hypothetical protein